jgi:hypothetical protein
MQILISQTSVVASKQFRGCSRALSLDNLPHINQRREVEADYRAAFGSFRQQGPDLLPLGVGHSRPYRAIGPASALLPCLIAHFGRTNYSKITTL